MKILLIIFLIITLISADIRFQDELQLKAHHNHDASLFTNENILNVHVIAHTHDDVGWLKTVDDYYQGNKNNIQQAGIQYIIDTTVHELLKDASRKFIYVEIAYFYRWWREQSDSMKQNVRKLVQNGQLEFINGGWCMNDEASTYYEDIIDQMTIGHQFLLQNFGVIPTIGWHIDPFGHQASQAALFSQMGFNAWFFARIDYQDKEKRLNNLGMEMIWHPNQNSGNDNYIFTHLQYYHYGPPPDFCFDKYCDDTPIMDDPTLENYNLDKKGEQLVSYFRNMSLHYKSNDLIHTFGSDFQYSNALLWFKNLDKVMKYINKNKEKFNMNIFYSTPTEYIKQINQQNISFPKKTDDFFPYADSADAFWTGYFTSRVALKGQVKKDGRYLQSIRTFFGLLKFHNQSNYLLQNEKFVQSLIDTFEQAMGVLQHHDAVAGTEKQYVANNYQQMLGNATYSINQAVFEVLKEQTKQVINLTIDNYQTCQNNETSKNCEIIFNSLNNKQSLLLTVYNPTIDREQVIRLKVPNAKFDIADGNNQVLDAEVICGNSTDPTDCDAFFIAELKSYSLNYLKIIYNDKSQKTKLLNQIHFGEFEIEKIIPIGKSKSVKMFKFTNQFQYKISDILLHKFKVNYNYYKSYQGNGQHSGAYIFRPALDSFFYSVPYSDYKDKIAYVGQILTAIQLTGDKTDTYLRFYNYKNDTLQSDNIIEIETYIHSIMILNKRGKEVVLQIQSDDINNQQLFYTDSNGLELQERKINYRPTWKLKVTQPAAGNYYPVNSMIQIEDKNTKNSLALLNDRSQGGTSLQKGQLELMIHRRLLVDDGRGVGEPLNETERWDRNQGLSQKVQHWLVFFDGNKQNEKDLPRLKQINNDLYPLLYFSSLDKQQDFQMLKNNNKMTFSFVSDFKDPFLKVYLRYNGQNQYLFRLHNMNENKNINVSSEFFSIKEMSMTYNQLKSDMQNNKMKWKEEQDNNSSKEDLQQRVINIPFKAVTDINIRPLEMRTFIIESPHQKAIKVTPKWVSQPYAQTITLPTLQVVVNPQLKRESKIHDNVFENLKKLKANLVRFALWFPYPRLSVAQLYQPDINPNCASIEGTPTVSPSSQMTLFCTGYGRNAGVISKIVYASYGNGTGRCGSFIEGKCNITAKAQQYAQLLCIGKQACQITIDTPTLGDPCVDVVKRFDIQYECSQPTLNTNWDFSLIDPLIEDFLGAQENRTSVISFSTIPQYMYITPQPVKFPDDPNQVAWDYEQGTKLYDQSMYDLGQYYKKVAQWYSKGGFVDEAGVQKTSKYNYKFTNWEIFNEVEAEHLSTVDYYTKQFDSISQSVAEVDSDIKFVGLALQYHNEWSWYEYFLDAKNHDLEGAKHLDAISFHFYAIPAQNTSETDWAAQFLVQANNFVEEVKKVRQIRDQLSPKTKLMANEVGCICSKTPLTTDYYWNICGAMYAHLYAQISEQNIDLLGASQLVGFPSQYPDVSMVDWETGNGNARYHILKMMIDQFGYKEELMKQMFEVDIQFPANQNASNVTVKAYKVEGQQKVLIINMQNTDQSIEVTDSIGQTIYWVDSPMGPIQQLILEETEFVLNKYSVAIIVYNTSPVMEL